MTRKETNDALIRWVTEKAAAHGGIELLALYGSYLNGTAGERSDIDVYFIPADESARSSAREIARDFARTFLLDGVGYDIYPRSWENLAAIASMESFMTPCLADVQVLYGTDAAKMRFASLQEKLRGNLADAAYCRRIAKKRFAEACRLADTPGYLLMALGDVIAALNGRYFRYGIKRYLTELALMENKPADFIAAAGALIASPTRGGCEALIASVGAYTGFAAEIPPVTHESEPPKDAANVASLYEEISSTFGKIYTAAENGDVTYAFLAASNLAGELAWTGWALPPLMDAWRADDLGGFAEHTRKVEAALVGEIEARGGKIRRYADFSEFAENIK